MFVSASSSDPKQLVPIQECSKETTLTLATSHALVLLEDGTLVGDPMEKTTLEALGWQIGKGQLDTAHVKRPRRTHSLMVPSLCFLSGDLVTPKADHETPHKAEITMKRRYQFSSALKRMSTVSYVPEGKSKKTLVSVKGAPETLKTMYATVPDNYDETYKWFTRRGSRVLALGWKHMDNISANEVGPFSAGSICYFASDSELLFAADQPPRTREGRDRTSVCRLPCFPLPAQARRCRVAQDAL